MRILPATVAMPEGLGRPEHEPNAVVSPGHVFRTDDHWEITRWHFTGPWPHHCVTPDGVHLYFGYTLEELQAIAAQR